MEFYFRNHLQAHTGNVSRSRRARKSLLAWIGIPLLAMLTACGEPASVSDWTERPDFSGRWKLNEARSDDVAACVQKAVNSLSSPRTNALGRFLGKKSSLMTKHLAAAKPMVHVPDHLTIESEDSCIYWRDSDGNDISLRTDSREQILPLSGEKKIRATTRWHDEHLESDATLEGETHLNTTCEMLPGGQQFLITARLTNQLLAAPVVVKVVYDFDGELPPMAGLQEY